MRFRRLTQLFGSNSLATAVCIKRKRFIFSSAWRTLSEDIKNSCDTPTEFNIFAVDL